MRRRDFLKLVIGGTAISFWSEPVRFTRLIPFVTPPEDIVPGVSTWYATSCRECPAGCGLIVRNREARATKVEGNPLHPINAGKVCARGQAAVQGLYDPDRLQHPLRREGGRAHTVDWDTALREIGGALASLRGTGQVAVISDLQAGSLDNLIRDWLRAFGSERYLVYEPFNYEPLREANRLVFGRAEIPDYRLDRCDFILSLGADFLETWISPVKFTRRFAERRAPSDGRMSRFVYAGPRLSLTAMNADEYLLLSPGDERDLALAMLHVLVEEGLAKRDGEVLGAIAAGFAPEQVGPRIGVRPERIRQIARHLGRAKTAVVLAGSPAPGGSAATEAAVAANLLNYAVGSGAVDFGRTHALGGTATSPQIAEFISALGDRRIKALVVVGANPAYSLPPGYMFAGTLFGDAMFWVPLVVSISSFPDETARLASWVLPANTPLESWGDYATDGAFDLMQPVMGTRLDTRPTGDILLQLAEAAGVGPVQARNAADHDGGDQPAATYYDYLRSWWRVIASAKGQGAESFWRASLQRGGHWSEAEPAPLPPLAAQAAGMRFAPRERSKSPSLWLYPSAMLFDGRGANRRWLQEIPDVVNHAVWDSWVEMHPDTAKSLHMEPGQVAEVSTGAGKVRAPVFTYEGVVRGTVALAWGQGHTAYGRYAANRGANAFQLQARPLDRGEASPTVTLSPQPQTEPVVTTDASREQHGRHLADALLLSELPRQRPEPLTWPLPKGYNPEVDLYAPHPHTNHRWAMAIDIARCVGCEACVAACYAENNIAIVGTKWVAQGREMSWLRIDRYFEWGSPQPARFLPMLCQHCDAAPCEPVCPVYAAAHTEEGLNQQIYNRCIGTRYCSNNCPYKVRRFNWRNYDWPEPLAWQLNPDVTVRVRGVMEKCTFCVQRIREAEYRAKKEGRPLRDGEITPACAQACPAEVFVFGDLMDPDSRVSRLVRGHPRRFQSLRDLNTKPAVFYLKKVINDLSV
jgi:molybdopterin-containing oxidoreductase family iron-sulfur binding subunit